MTSTLGERSKFVDARRVTVERVLDFVSWSIERIERWQFDDTTAEEDFAIAELLAAIRRLADNAFAFGRFVGIERPRPSVDTPSKKGSSQRVRSS